jgi:hypothetical protein
MTCERLVELERDINARLTKEEMQKGWHFCDEFDGLCTDGELVNPEDPYECICGFDRRKVK